MAVRIIPPKNQLARWLEAGLTHEEIVDKIEEETGQRVTRPAVSLAVKREGLDGIGRSRTIQRRKEEIPWRVQPRHLQRYPVRMLRLYARARSGGALNEGEASRLDSWLAKLHEEGLVVAYDPDSYEGFLYVDREPGDPADIPIRRRRVWLDPPRQSDT